MLSMGPIPSILFLSICYDAYNSFHLVSIFYPVLLLCPLLFRTRTESAGCRSGRGQITTLASLIIYIVQCWKQGVGISSSLLAETADFVDFLSVL